MSNTGMTLEMVLIAIREHCKGNPQLSEIMVIYAQLAYEIGGRDEIARRLAELDAVKPSAGAAQVEVLG